METSLSGQYYEGNSLIHRLNATIKLVALVFLIAIPILADSLIDCGLVIMITMASIWLCHVPLSIVLQPLKRIYLFYILIIITNAFFYTSEVYLWKFWIFTLSNAGIRQGLSIVFRILPIVIYGSIFCLTTKPMEITAAIAILLRPLRMLHLPVDNMTLILSIALQFIPTLTEETERLKIAQISRGARFQSKKLHERAMAILPLLIPIFLISFKKADDLSIAMEARGYGSGQYRRYQPQKNLNFRNFLTLGFLFFILGYMILF